MPRKKSQNLFKSKWENSFLLKHFHKGVWEKEVQQIYPGNFQKQHFKKLTKQNILGNIIKITIHECFSWKKFPRKLYNKVLLKMRTSFS